MAKSNRSLKLVKGKKRLAPKRLSRHVRPHGMNLKEWQIALRRDFGQKSSFQWENTTKEAVFSLFKVDNPETGKQYTVEIMGRDPGSNYCTCPDFSVNLLGTCKHIEFVLFQLEKQPGAKEAFQKGFSPSFSLVRMLYGAKRRVALEPADDCLETFSEIADEYFDEYGILKNEAVARFQEFVARIRESGHPLKVREDVWDRIAMLQDRVERHQRIADKFGGDPEGVADRILSVPLYPYQAKGAVFAASAGRSIIADDMGLGKTIQAIGAAEILAKTMGIEKVLIVCPTSLKYQWKQEIESFSQRSASVVEGLAHIRSDRYHEEGFYKIANYESVYRDVKTINLWAPDMIILDEAQRIKNWETKTAQAMKSLQADYALVLTGTPIENRLEELFSIVQFVDQHRLGPLYAFLDRHRKTDATGRVVGYQHLSSIAETLEPILLRRSKSIVAHELPERVEKRFFVPMTRLQMEYHNDQKYTVARITAKWRRMGFLTQTDHRRLMSAMTIMRMSCNSTYLVDKKTDEGHKVDELMNWLEDVMEGSDAKVVVFSQWLGTHELIARELDKRRWEHVYFHGGVPSPKRKELVKRFREHDNCRVFLATDAGSTGLNLQFASMVVNMDLPWNPAVLEQRIGRVHRLGQANTVNVVNFVARGTIEHGMLSLIRFKKSLFSGVLDGGEDHVALEGQRLKQFMESVESATEAIPEPSPEGDASLAEGDGFNLGAEASTPSQAPTGLGSAGHAEPHAKTSDHREKAQHGEQKTSTVSPGGTEAWEEALSAGLSFVGKLGEALFSGKEDSAPANAAKAVAQSLSSPETARQAAKPVAKLLSEISLRKDPETGKQSIEIPVPPQEIVDKVSGFLAAFIKNT